uniref:Integrase catalytic domain-containing protein n=1 Tax=Nicotiana tabacum TaxID=4097 RepID=A0A1S4ANH2_TOBAC
MIINVESQRRNNATVGVGDHTALMSNRAHTGGHNRGYKPRNNFGNSSLQCAYAHTASIAPDSATQQGSAANVVPAYGSTTDSPSAITGTITALISHLVSNNWIIDTGATNHMAHILNLLSNIRKLSDSDQNSFQLLDGEKVIISHTGDLSLFKDKSVHHELFTGKVMGIGKEDHGLYIMKHKEQDVPKQLPDPRPFHSSPFNKRLGYVPLGVLNKIESLPNVQLKEHLCTVCSVAKQTRIPFSSSNACSINAFDLIHVDVWGPYRVPTHNGRRYFMTLVDDYSRFIWLFLMNDKAEFIVILRNFLLLVKNQFHCSIKCLRPDNGTEFFNNQ